MPTPIDVAAVLAAAGLVPGPDGYDPAALVAAIEGRARGRPPTGPDTGRWWSRPTTG